MRRTTDERLPAAFIVNDWFGRVPVRRARVRDPASSLSVGSPGRAPSQRASCEEKATRCDMLLSSYRVVLVGDFPAKVGLLPS